MAKDITPIVVNTTMRTRVFDLIKQKETRDRVTLSFRDIEKRTGIAQSTISNYASNSVKRFDAHTVETLMAFFELTSYDDFFERVQIDDGTQKQ